MATETQGGHSDLAGQRILVVGGGSRMGTGDSAAGSSVGGAGYFVQSGTVAPRVGGVRHFRGCIRE